MKSQDFHYGYCVKCQEPLGFFGGESEETFCYNCSNYKKLENEKAISYYKEELNKIRLEFRNGINNGHIDRYFANYLTFGEAILGTEEKEYLTISSERIDTVGFINFNSFVLANIGIKWILEDLNYISGTSEDYQDSIFALPKKWIIYLQRLIYLENELGFVLIDDNTYEKFYYLERLKFNFESLNQFGLINPEEIDTDKFKEIKEDLLEKEKDPDYVKQFVNLHLPLYFVCMAYVQYPKMTDRIFSFKDILYSPILIDYIGYIIEKYKDKRAKSPEEWSKENPYFLNIEFDQLKSDIPEIKWDNILYSHVVSSQTNPLSYPLLIEYKGKIVITPTRLKLAREMMFERLYHDTFHNYLSIIYESEFQWKILALLEEYGCNVKDPVSKDYWIYISDKKNNTFEFDIMATFKNYIIIIECKSFHPTAFYHLKDAVFRREERVKHFHKQFIDKIKNWIKNNLKKESKGGYVSINCRKREIGEKSTQKFTINFEEQFRDIKDELIVSLFITQYKEFFKGYPEIFQIFYEDLEKFLKNLE